MNAENHNYDILKSLLELEEQRVNTLDSTGQSIKTWSITVAIAISGIIIERSNSRLSVAIITLAFLFSSIDFAYRKAQLEHVLNSILIKNEIVRLMVGNQFKDLKKMYEIKNRPILVTSFFSFQYDYFRELLYWPIIYIAEILLALILIWLIPNNLSVSFVRNLTIISLGVVVYLFFAAADCFRILQGISSMAIKSKGEVSI